jgi:sugar lactone lactonase YvrE
MLVDTSAGGVVHVTHRGFKPGGRTVNAVEVLRLGTGMAVDAAPNAFSQVFAFLLDEHGSLYVLDHVAQEIRVFDSAGVYRSAIGRKGAGPGEFMQAVGLAWAPDRTLWVADVGNHRYSRFSRAGDFLESEQVRFTHWRPGFHVAVDGVGSIYDEFYGGESRLW